MPILGVYGKGPYGRGTYGAPHGPLRVLSAESLNPYSVLVYFDQPIDIGFPPFLDPSNYTIPDLTVTGAVFASGTSIQLTTSEQSYKLYTVTVGAGRSISGQFLDVLHRSAPFTGHAATAGYFALALGKRRVRLLFSATMQANAALSDPTSFYVEGLDGVPKPVIAVHLEQSTDVLSVILVFGQDLVDTQWYRVIASLNVKTTGGLSLVPNTVMFQWNETVLELNLPLTWFTGEVQDELFGNPAGLVFFSPALEVPAANSVIQIDEVDVCTTAYDIYEPPVPVDPFPFYTWVPNGPQTTLGQAGVTLWAPFPRLVEAQFNVTLTPTDTVPPPVSESAHATMREPWDHSYVALLNSPPFNTAVPPQAISYWGLFGTGPDASPITFITANNLGPIPPGPFTTILLREPSSAGFEAGSEVGAELSVRRDIGGNFSSNSSFGVV
jgi:hypothetical protein